jgi:hypothetical protein
LKNQWRKLSNGAYELIEVSQFTEQLPFGVYTVEVVDEFGTLGAKPVQPQFEFPYKLYNLNNKFVARVVRTYEGTNGNLGVLFTGIKGTGKTVTAQMIANRLGLPVLIVPKNYKTATPLFINDIPQDVCIFFDEYEKIYDRDNSDILAVMDGALNSEHRRVFLLTTNNLYINDNMLQRPGRIRYVVEYKDLPRQVIEEIIDDMLISKEHRDAAVSYISSLEIVTIDTVKAVVTEINIHNEAPSAFEDVFNCRKIDTRYDIFVETSDPKETLRRVHSDVELNVRKIDKGLEGNYLILDGHYNLGKIQRVLSPTRVAVKGQEYWEQAPSVKTYIIKSIWSLHSSFREHIIGSEEANVEQILLARDFDWSQVPTVDFTTKPKGDNND